jgi:hypothetical protein
MLRLDRLFVLWSDPGQGRRHVVGQLSRDHRGHAFAYSQKLGDARAAGFRPVAEFPEPRGEDDPYVRVSCSGHLPSAFPPHAGLTTHSSWHPGALSTPMISSRSSP